MQECVSVCVCVCMSVCMSVCECVCKHMYMRCVCAHADVEGGCTSTSRPFLISSHFLQIHINQGWRPVRASLRCQWCGIFAAFLCVHNISFKNPSLDPTTCHLPSQAEAGNYIRTCRIRNLCKLTAHVPSATPSGGRDVHTVWGTESHVLQGPAEGPAKPGAHTPLCSQSRRSWSAPGEVEGEP